jgi:long-chain acyl-CoA synthetase
VNIADHAIEAADSPALIVADGTVSYGELYANSRRVAALLYEAGLRPGSFPGCTTAR